MRHTTYFQQNWWMNQMLPFFVTVIILDKEFCLLHTHTHFDLKHYEMTHNKICYNDLRASSISGNLNHSNIK